MPTPASPSPRNESDLEAIRRICSRTSRAPAEIFNELGTALERALSKDDREAALLYAEAQYRVATERNIPHPATRFAAAFRYAGLLAELGRYREAVPLFEDLATRAPSIDGGQYLDMKKAHFTCLRAIADGATATGNFDSAVKLHGNALAFARTNFGELSLEAIRTMINQVTAAARTTECAEDFSSRARATRSAVERTGVLTPEQKGAALYDLAAQLFQRGLSDEGAATLERACHFPISIGTRILALGMLSKVALHRGDTETAGDLITALEEFEVHPEFGNPARRLVAQCRAAFAKEQGNEVEYAAELDAATYVAPGEELSSAERLDVFMNRARLALEESRLADAHEALDHADDLVQLQGQTTIRRAEVLLLRATIKEQEEEFVEAEELVTQALVIGRRLLPSSSPFLAHPLQRLAALAVRGSEDADVEDESNHEKLQQAYACASEALRILEDAGRKTSALVALHERKKRDLQWASGEEPDSGSSDF